MLVKYCANILQIILWYRNVFLHGQLCGQRVLHKNSENSENVGKVLCKYSTNIAKYFTYFVSILNICFANIIQNYVRILYKCCENNIQI